MTATGYTLTGTVQSSIVAGSAAAGGTLTLKSTTNATKGKILLGSSATYDEANVRIGIGTTAPVDALTISSSFAGGENTSDSTSRLHLESYQRAQMTNVGGQYASYGEVIRIYSRRWDSKQMIAWYGPTSYNPDGTAATSDVTWFWMGAHYEANDHASVHGHWSLEVPDSTGQMQTRFEFRIWDPVTGTFGMDRTVAKFNAADVIVACDNGSLQIANSAGNTKNIYFTNDTLAATSGRRWLLQADGSSESGSNVGTDYRILRYNDSGAQIDTALFIKRSTGAVGIGNITAPAAKMDVSEAGSRHTIQATQTTASTISFAAYSGILGSSANRYFDGRVSGDSSGRFVAYGDGKLEWGDGGAGGRDVNLYRSSADVLRTDDHLVVAGAITSVDTYVNLPKGATGSTNASVIVGSSYAGGDDDGSGTDSTGRINLYAYQRANVRSFGELIRSFLMRSDAKAMSAWYGPTLLYDGTSRDPAVGTGWKPWCWTGAHYEANDHGSIHGHWEVEIPDSTGALQGRLEIPFIDQSLTNTIASTTIGVDYTNIRTNRADFSVRAQNITTGTYAGQNTALRVGGGNTINKDILLSISSDMSTTGRRWAIRANTDTESGSSAGTNFAIVRYDDAGGQLGTAVFIERATGNVLLGASGTGSGARLTAKWSTSGTHGFSAQPSSTPGSAAGFDAQMTTTTDRAYQAQATGDTSRRWVVYGDGKTEWGDGTSRDTNLYRQSAGRLKTDGNFHVVGSFGVGAVPSATDTITVTQTIDANGIAITNTTVAGNVGAPNVRLESATTASLGLTSRVTGEAVSRFLFDVTGKHQWGDGTNAKDTNLYRNAADQLKTDDSLVVALRAAVGAALGTDTFSAVSDGSIAAGLFKATADGTASKGVLTVEAFSASKRGFDFRVTSDNVARLKIDSSAGTGSGTITFGNGTTADTNLYRSATTTLKTDNSFHVGADLRHLGSNLGFYNATAVAKQTVTGSRGSNAALASLITALANLGLLTDSTT